MPKIIRHVLFQKVAQLKELRRFQEDFFLITGLRLAFLDELGKPYREGLSLAPLCGCIQKSGMGARMCEGVRRQVLSEAKEHPAIAACDAGLREAAAPVRVSGIVAGRLVFVGVMPQGVTGHYVRRVLHLLSRAGVEFKEAELERLLGESRVVSNELMGAYLRVLESAARDIASRMTAHMGQTSDALPPLVEQACRVVRRRALSEDIDLEDVAGECKVSVSHLSRVFHHGTGITFREYVARWRAEHAEQLLRTTNRPITRIAFESGFQSISQFNRVFRTIYGRSPRTFRMERKSDESEA